MVLQKVRGNQQGTTAESALRHHETQGVRDSRIASSKLLRDKHLNLGTVDAASILQAAEQKLRRTSGSLRTRSRYRSSRCEARHRHLRRISEVRSADRFPARRRPVTLALRAQFNGHGVLLLSATRTVCTPRARRAPDMHHQISSSSFDSFRIGQQAAERDRARLPRFRA